YVTDQEEARRFYTEKLGFEVRTDVTMDGGFRWLTLGLSGQPDPEVAPMEPKPGPNPDEDSARTLRPTARRARVGLAERAAPGAAHERTTTPPRARCRRPSRRSAGRSSTWRRAR